MLRVGVCENAVSLCAELQAPMLILPGQAEAVRVQPSDRLRSVADIVPSPSSFAVSVFPFLRPSAGPDAVMLRNRGPRVHTVWPGDEVASILPDPLSHPPSGKAFLCPDSGLLPGESK